MCTHTLDLFLQVNELSHPSSTQVEEIIQQLVHNILRRFFQDKLANENAQEGNDELFDVIGTSRDNLAKLLFWCVISLLLMDFWCY